MDSPIAVEGAETEGRTEVPGTSGDAPGPVAPRPFRLLDAIILVAYLALALAVQEAFGRLFASRGPGVFDARRYALAAATWMLIASIVLACLALAGPGPGLRERMRRPGVLALVLTLFALAYATVQSWSQEMGLVGFRGRPFPGGAFWWVFGPIYRTAFNAGIAVWAGWMTLGLAGCWRASPDWLDRSGRVLGVGWIVLGLLMGLAEMNSVFNEWFDRLGLG